MRDLGGGPFWLRPAEGYASQRTALKPLSLEQVMRSLIGRRPPHPFWIVQKALKVTAVGICRSLPAQGRGSHGIEVQVTLLQEGKTLTLQLPPRPQWLNGWFENPIGYFPPSFPLRGYQLFELVGVVRRLAARWVRTAEVEWVLAGGKMFVLDARQSRDART